MSRSRPKTPRWLSAALAQNRSPKAGTSDWLSRALSRAGVLPREEVEAAIAAGRVAVNGRTQRQPLAAYAPTDTVTLDGRPVSLVATTRALMLHKPDGVVSAPRDPEQRGTVFQVLRNALPEALRPFEWHAVGRLDRNTTGLLLFTNDEKLVAHVTSPTTHLSKRYVAQVSGQPTPEKLKQLEQGMVLDDGPTRPAQARMRDARTVELTLTEGRHHQVKRMLGAVGLPVLTLHREAVGGLTLDVPVGQLRSLTDEEIREALGFGSR